MKIFKFVLSLLISLLCIYLATRKVDIQGVIHVFATCNYQWILVASLIALVKLSVMAYRWLFFIPNSSKGLFSILFHSYAIGNMANMILPFRSGDLIRTYLGAKECKIKVSTFLGTLASEHLLDFFVLLFLFYSVLFLYSQNFPTWVTPTFLYLAIFGLIFISIFIFIKKNKNITHKITKITLSLQKGFFARFTGLLGSFLNGFMHFKDSKNFTMIFLGTFGIWLFQFLWVYALLLAFNLPETYSLGFEAVLTLVVTMGLAVIIPASPSFIGTLHLLIVIAMEQMNIPSEVALSYAILAHAHGALVSILIGLVSMWRKGWGIRLNSVTKTFDNIQVSKKEVDKLSVQI